VARSGPNGPEALLEKVVITGLGEGLQAGGFLKRSAVERTVHAAVDLVNDAAALSAHPRIVGTAALREALDPESVVVPIEVVAGCEVEILSPDREGILAREGTLSGMESLRRAVVVDLGGRSTEVIWPGAEDRISWVSLALGASRTQEAFLGSGREVRDAPAWLEEHALREIRKADGPWNRKDATPALAACGGTAAILGSLEVGLPMPECLSRIHGLFLGRERVESWFQKLAGTDDAGRVALGVPPDRAPVVGAGAAILWSLLVAMPRLDGLRISARGLRWGVVGRLLAGRDF